MSKAGTKLVKSVRKTLAYVREETRAGFIVHEPDEIDVHRKTAQKSILAGYRDLAAGRVFPSNGDFHEDMKTLAKKDSADWH